VSSKFRSSIELHIDVQKPALPAWRVGFLSKGSASMKSWLALGLLLCLSSCSSEGGDYDGPVGQVTGVVNLGDKPLTEHATLTFMSKDGYSSTAILDGTGEFRMKFNGSNDIPVGSYRIAVMPNIPEEPQNQDPASFFNKDGTTKVVKIVTSKIPTRYRATGTSGVDIEVKEGKNTLKIDLDLK